MPTPNKRSRSTSRSPSRTSKSSKASSARKKTASASKREATSLLLRDLDPEVARVLRSRAKRSGRSLQQELHAALRRDAKRNFDEAAAISDAWHQRLKGRKLPDTTELLREDRAR